MTPLELARRLAGVGLDLALTVMFGPTEDVSRPDTRPACPTCGKRGAS